ncbi:hypothetical protein ACCO45_007209 [Purpureocillium lilacinum]|uniref:Uncharacterized protein n=1 Tax=Purpureocillium lilacinum TaxID=33203 RepID=A0ACC4DRR6_PURLI
MALEEYTYVFVIGTLFAMLDAYNNGANDVANSWATSVSSRSISYRQAMIFGTIFEMLGAITVGARTADTIKNGIIPNSAFKGDAGVQMLAFTCALAAASSWVMWCTRHSAHVSSTYSLISAVAGVGVATVGASKVQWGWNDGKGLGAIFAGLGMAPVISGGFAATIFMLIKLVVHMRKRPVEWAVWTSPFFFPHRRHHLHPIHRVQGIPQPRPQQEARVVRRCRDHGHRRRCRAPLRHLLRPLCPRQGHQEGLHRQVVDVRPRPLLFKRPAPADADRAKVPNYAVVQDEHDDQTLAGSPMSVGEDGTHKAVPAEAPLTEPAQDHEKLAAKAEATQATYKELVAQGESRFHARLMEKRGPLGWAMRTLRDNPMGAGQMYELHNIKILAKRIPAMVVRVYANAEKYPNEVEHTYSFVQVLTACTASFAHGANDIGNSVGPWAVIYSAWSTGNAAAAKAPVPVWQLAVLSATISLGLITYGYNIMKVMGNKITYHSPSRGSSMEMGAAITVLVFSQFSLPVSTSMCITGATVGVGLCNGTLKAVNFQRVGLLLLSWIMTIPIAGTIGGVLMGLFLNAPHFK